MTNRRRRGGRLGRRAATLAAVLLLPFAAPPVVLSQEMAPVLPGALEGRPPAAETSPLQARIDAAAAGSTVEVAPGDYTGDLVVDKPLRLVGRGRPRLVGSGNGSVVRVRADEVTVEGFAIDGRRGGDLSRDSAGVHSAARGTTLRDLEIRDALFGVYLREANGAVVERCRVRGIPGRDPGEKGSGIHAYNLEGFRFDDNEVVDVRDGLYLQNASKGTLRRNVARDVRYGLHYMFSDDNVFEDNTFENGAAGTAIMYSERLVFRRNRFLRNRGFASVGLLFQSCDDVLAEENLVADNARGVFIEGSHRVTLRRNVIAGSDVAVVLYDPDGGHRFEGNSFVGNMTPLDLVARQTDTVFLGNYWSANGEPDLDGDGRSDRPYRLTSVFDHFRGNLTAADLLSDSFAAAAVGAAERAFPVLRLVPVEDASPLARPPLLPGVPRPDAGASGPSPAGIAASLALGLAGAAVLARGRRPSTGSRPGNKMEPAAS
jgi:nitrous oxidase accessory protein